MIRTLAASASLLALSAAPAFAQDIVESEQADFQIETVAEGLNMPWSIGFLPGGEMLVTERDGAGEGLRVIDADGNLVDDPVAGLPGDIVTGGQSGLFDAIPHPDFEDNRLVYISYAKGTGDAHKTALIRGRLSEDLTELEEVEDLFEVDFEMSTNRHHGGKIVFHEGHVYLGLGDGGDHMDEAQNPQTHLGSVVRLTEDGEPADGNPFSGEDGAAGVFTYGNRNVQGLAVNPATGSVWAHEHGPRGGDEINVLEAGNNYGWPDATYGIDYDGSTISEDRSLDGVTEPIWYWNPSIAVSGMAFHNGEAFPEWENDVFVGALAGMQLVRMETDGDRVIGSEPLLEDREQRIRDVRVSPDGHVYVLIDDPEGEVLRLAPAD